jgi:FMN-dependent NADH-azoreductase
LHPGINVIYRDLASEPALHLTGEHLAAWQGAGADNSVLADDLSMGNAYMKELLESEIIVIETPMYNLTIPTPLKACIDRVALAGKTFRYTANGPEGLLQNKQAFIASARGGVYSLGSPAAAPKHQESYLTGLLGFLGISDTTVVRSEVVAFGPEAKDAELAQARNDIAAISAD